MGVVPPGPAGAEGFLAATSGGEKRHETVLLLLDITLLIVHWT